MEETVVSLVLFRKDVKLSHTTHPFPLSFIDKVA
jgi:hypothetical protein